MQSGRVLLCFMLASLYLLSANVWSQEPIRIPASERAALISLYTSTNGDGWTTHTNWNGPAGTECTWYGITCNAGRTTVNAVSLPTNNLTGTLAPNLNALSNLGIFDVHGNRLTGSIPALAGLTQLGTFDASENQLSGSIPALAGLTALRSFIVAVNQLTGTIPELAGVPNLELFQVILNHLTGPVPSLAGLTRLLAFDIAANQLTGNMPPVPVPAALQAGRSNLCPNFLNHTPDPSWDAATGEAPWYTNCAIVPQAGLWWNPTESGSGYALDFKHGVLVVTVYSYTAAGVPIWYLASGPVTNNTFTSTLDKYQNGQCISCAYRPAALNGNDGTISIFFTSPTSATLTLPGGRNVQIVPQAF